MTLLDIIIFIVALIGFLLGFKDGIVRKLIGFIGFIAAVFAAAKFSDDFGFVITKVFGIEGYLSEIIAGIVIYILITVVTALIKRWIHPHDKINNLVNRIAGGVAGTIQILFFISAFLFIINIFNLPKEETKQKSLFYKPVYSIIPATVNYVNNFNVDIKKEIKTKINQKNNS